MKLLQYPLNPDGAPMDLVTGVITDASGNGGTKTPLNYGPDGSPIDSLGLILVDKDGNPMAFGGIESYVDKTALADSQFSGNKLVFLAEAGFEGLFEFDTADLSAFVAADVNKGLFVAPTASSSGVNGAWRRRFTGPINPHWFNIRPANAAATNTAAWTAMRSVLRLIARASNPGDPTGFVRSYGIIQFPDDERYFFNGPLDLEGSWDIRGWGPATRYSGTQLVWDNTSSGFILDYGNSSASGTGSSWTRLYNLVLIGGWGAGGQSEAERHAIQASDRVDIERCQIKNWAGDGINIVANSPTGNANGGRISHCAFENVRNGLYIDGADANNIVTYGCDYMEIRRFGEWRSEFLGGTSVNPQYADCGHTLYNDGVVVHASYVSHGGNLYYMIHSDGATNAPTGAATNNTWWNYLSAGAPSPGFPAWFNGILSRVGGPVWVEGDSNAVTLINPYGEGGQSSMLFSGRTVIIGGQVECGIRGTGVWLRNGAGLAVLDYLQVNNGFLIPAPDNSFGPTTGPALDSTLYLNSTNIFNNIFGRSWNAGVSQIDGQLSFVRNTGIQTIGYPNVQVWCGPFGGASKTATWSNTGLAMEPERMVLTAASAAARAGLRLPHGAAPAAPTDGDVWTTTAGLFVRINGATQGPFGTGGVADGDKGDITVSGAGTVYTIDPATVTFAKIQDVAANSILARVGTTSGVISAVALGGSQLMGRGATGDVGAQNIGAGLLFQSNTLRTAPTEQSSANGATITPTFTVDFVDVTAQNTNFTLANWTGTAIDGHGVVVRVKDNGTSRTWAYGVKYQAADGLTMPTATTVGKTHELGFVYNAALDKFICISVVTY